MQCAQMPCACRVHAHAVHVQWATAQGGSTSCLTGVSSDVSAAPARTPATKVTGLEAIVCVPPQREPPARARCVGSFVAVSPNREQIATKQHGSRKRIKTGRKETARRFVHMPRDHLRIRHEPGMNSLRSTIVGHTRASPAGCPRPNPNTNPNPNPNPNPGGHTRASAAGCRASSSPVRWGVPSPAAALHAFAAGRCTSSHSSSRATQRSLPLCTASS